MTFVAWFIFGLAALLEVGGDAMIRTGLRRGLAAGGQGPTYVTIGFLVLGCYGLMVNMVKWDFSKLLGVYVAVFALVSILFGRLVFNEFIPLSTWAGLGLIMAGSLLIQIGPRG